MTSENGEFPTATGQPAADVAAPGADSAPAAETIERAIGQITGVRAARVVRAAAGRVAEVHVLAAPGRSAKQVVRDVQSVVLTTFGLPLDYRVVSVVQLDQEEVSAPHVPTMQRRPVLRRLSAQTASFATEVSVGVGIGGEEVARTTRGPATAGLRLIAQAIVDAVSDTLEAETADVEFADVLGAAGHSVALVVLRVLTGRGDHVVTGSAVVRRDANDAIARATLAALNRFVHSG